MFKYYLLLILYMMNRFPLAQGAIKVKLYSVGAVNLELQFDDYKLAPDGVREPNNYLGEGFIFSPSGKFGLDSKVGLLADDSSMLDTLHKIMYVIAKPEASPYSYLITLASKPWHNPAEGLGNSRHDEFDMEDTLVGLPVEPIKSKKHKKFDETLLGIPAMGGSKSSGFEILNEGPESFDAEYTPIFVYDPTLHALKDLKGEVVDGSAWEVEDFRYGKYVFTAPIESIERVIDRPVRFVNSYAVDLFSGDTLPLKEKFPVMDRVRSLGAQDEYNKRVQLEIFRLKDGSYLLTVNNRDEYLISDDHFDVDMSYTPIDSEGVRSHRVRLKKPFYGWSDSEMEVLRKYSDKFYRLDMGKYIPALEKYRFEHTYGVVFKSLKEITSALNELPFNYSSRMMNYSKSDVRKKGRLDVAGNVEVVFMVKDIPTRKGPKSYIFLFVNDDEFSKFMEYAGDVLRKHTKMYDKFSIFYNDEFYSGFAFTAQQFVSFKQDLLKKR